VTMIHLLAEFVTGQTHLFCIENNDKVTRINARRINGLVLAAQDLGNFCSRTAQNVS
jgi:hypothetical protein